MTGQRTRGEVLAIHIAPRAGAAMTALDAVEAVADEGLHGDRYFTRTGTYSKQHGPDRELTLVEAEALEALRAETGLALAPEESRRNLLTRGIDLNALVGRRFTVGEVELEGVRLCEPCGYLERITGKPVREPLVGRGGLRARIVVGGTLRVGDPVVAGEAVAQAPTPTAGG